MARSGSGWRRLGCRAVARGARPSLGSAPAPAGPSAGPGSHSWTAATPEGFPGKRAPASGFVPPARSGAAEGSVAARTREATWPLSGVPAALLLGGAPGALLREAPRTG